ncbi:MAG TPA: NAD(P)H-binding protein, partial [Anaerolineae bacterium]
MADLILLTGATGFVGRRLLTALTQAGYHVRAVSRTARPSTDQVEWVQADLMDARALRSALANVRTVFYLVHSMGGTAWKLDYAFAERDRAAAETFALEAERAGLDRIIYLGGLGDRQAQLSRHLASRNQVGEILQSGAVPTTVLRAGIILGAGSASFEMLRYLVARLPVMITPRWVNTRTQPIAVRD